MQIDQLSKKITSMPDHGGNEPLGERLAKLEAIILELNRQQEANWSRTDANAKELSDMKVLHVQTVAKLDSDISHLNVESLKETFKMKAQIAEIGWRVGIVVGAFLLILNFVLSKIDLSGFLPKSDTKIQGKR